MTVTIRQVQASMKHNAAPARVAAYVDEITDQTNANKLTTTETSRAMANAIMAQLGPDWWGRLRGEYLIAGQKDVLRPGDGRLVRFTHQYSGSQAWRDLYVHLRWEQVIHGGDVRTPALDSVGHLSSAVQAGDSWSGFARGVRSHQSGSRKWGDRLEQRDEAAEDRGRELARWAAMDGNLDYHRAAWRRYQRNAMNMPGMWDESRPRVKGTHAGGRLIDTIHTDTDIVRSSIVDVDPRAFDGRLDHWSVLCVSRVHARTRLRPALQLVPTLEIR